MQFHYRQQGCNWHNQQPLSKKLRQKCPPSTKRLMRPSCCLFRIYPYEEKPSTRSQVAEPGTGAQQEPRESMAQARQVRDPPASQFYSPTKPTTRVPPCLRPLQGRTHYVGPAGQTTQSRSPWPRQNTRGNGPGRPPAREAEAPQILQGPDTERE